MIIKIGVKALAKFMTAKSAQQRKILKDYKYPNPEGKAQAKYYLEAKNTINEFYKNNGDITIVDKKIQSLLGQMTLSQGQVRIKIKSNIRGINDYFSKFKDKQFKALDKISLSLEYEGVQINITPDLHVVEKDKEKFIRLEFDKDEPNEEVYKIMCQLIFEAFFNSGYSIPSNSILVYDVTRGNIIKGARMGSRMKANIISACKNISAIWEGI